MFVVVYLNEIKKYIPIIEKWIFDVNEEKLKNYGANSNQNVRFYWSRSGLNENGVPDGNHAPNFNLPTSNIFPPENEACYIGRVKFYFGKQICPLVLCNNIHVKYALR